MSAARIEEFLEAAPVPLGLPSPPQAKLVLCFYGLTAPATVTFAHRTQDPARLDRIVLSRRPS